MPRAPPPSSTTAGSRATENVRRRLLLERPEAGFAVPVEDLGDGAASALLDDLVDGHEAAAQARRDLRSERGLPGAHEADEREVPVEGGHRPMRSRYAP